MNLQTLNLICATVLLIIYIFNPTAHQLGIIALFNLILGLN